MLFAVPYHPHHRHQYQSHETKISGFNNSIIFPVLLSSLSWPFLCFLISFDTFSGFPPLPLMLLIFGFTFLVLVLALVLFFFPDRVFVFIPVYFIFGEECWGDTRNGS